jgi:hypothetical protein
MQSLVINDLCQVGDEARVLDVRLAEALEFERPRVIRELIKRNLAELERYARLPCHTATSHDGPGARPVEEYWLNEAQAILICMRSDAPRAAEVRAEIIAVFQAWRRGELVAASSQVTLTSIGELFDEKLAPVHRDLATLRLEITDVQKNVIFISKRVDDIVPRRDFPKEAQKQFKCVAVDKYDNECPSCRQVKLEAGEHHFDHYLGRELNGPEHGWVVCRKCNLRMASDAMFKASRRPHFEVFQDYRRQMFSGSPKGTSRKGSPTISDRDQGELF